MQNPPTYIVTFLIVTTFLIFLLAGFVITILYLYRKKQISYYKSIDKLKLDYEKNLLKSKIEVQEQTFHVISREIHDNISLSLTLAKLNLNTFNLNNLLNNNILINSSIDLLSKSIKDLSDISKSMSAEVIAQQGLIEALKNETDRLSKTGLYDINTIISGNTKFMDSQKELVIFRIIQEAFNNILKHSKANIIILTLNYDEEFVEISIEDNGSGFDVPSVDKKGAGLDNMKTRAQILNGQVFIYSTPKSGSKIVVNIPY